MKKVIILGFAENTRHIAPFNDESYELWICGELSMEHQKRVSRIFELHDIDTILKQTRFKEQYYNFLQNLKDIPVYTKKLMPNFPSSVAYPIDAINQKFSITRHSIKDGFRKVNYLTSTLSAMLALAIYEKYDEILIYGVDMQHDTEWGYQKCCFERLIGYAEGAGIQVAVADESDLCKSAFLYGWSDENEIRNIIGQREKFYLVEKSRLYGQAETIRAMENILRPIFDEKKSIEQKMHQLFGAEQAIEFLKTKAGVGNK